MTLMNMLNTTTPGDKNRLQWITKLVKGFRVDLAISTKTFAVGWLFNVLNQLKFQLKRINNKFSLLRSLIAGSENQQLFNSVIPVWQVLTTVQRFLRGNTQKRGYQAKRDIKWLHSLVSVYTPFC